MFTLHSCFFPWELFENSNRCSMNYEVFQSNRNRLCPSPVPLVTSVPCNHFEWFFPWSPAVSSRLYAEQCSAEYSGRPLADLQNSLFLSAPFSYPGFCPELSSYLGCPKPWATSLAQEVCTALPAASLPATCLQTLQQGAEQRGGPPASFVSCLPAITVLSCLRSSVMKNNVSFFLFLSGCCFRKEGKSDPCSSILARRESCICTLNIFLFKLRSFRFKWF